MSAFTIAHVVISLIAIGAGLVVLAGLLTKRRADNWTPLFLWTTVATSVTGFLFPFVEFLPSHAVGIISLMVLAVAIYARYGGRLERSWLWIYVVGAVMALYLNVFVLVVQAFQRVPVLKALAPTQSEPPFQVTQLIVLALFVVLGAAAVVRSRRAGAGPAVRSSSIVKRSEHLEVHP